MSKNQENYLSMAGPLTQADLDKMDFDKVWISYGPEPDNGEWALVYRGQLYSIDTLEGAGFENMLRDLMAGGESLDNPSGTYRVCQFSLKEFRNTLHDNPLTLEQLRGMGGQPVWIVGQPDRRGSHMDNEKLLKALGRLSVETGSLACLGCGWEHDCNTHGCAILRGVRFALEDAEARADEAEASLAAAVRDMEAMAATIRARQSTTLSAASSANTTAPWRTIAPAGRERSASSGGGRDAGPLFLPQESGVL